MHEKKVGGKRSDDRCTISLLRRGCSCERNLSTNIVLYGRESYQYSLFSMRRDRARSISMSHISSTYLPTIRQWLLCGTELHVRTRFATASHSVEGEVRSCNQTGWTIRLRGVQFRRTHISKVSPAPGYTYHMRSILQRSAFTSALQK